MGDHKVRTARTTGYGFRTRNSAHRLGDHGGPQSRGQRGTTVYGFGNGKSTHRQKNCMPFGAPADPFSTMRFACLLVWFFAYLASWNHTKVGSNSKSWNLGVLGGSWGGPGGVRGGPGGVLELRPILGRC